MKIKEKLKQIKSGELKPLIKVLEEVSKLLVSYTNEGAIAKGMIDALIKLFKS